VLRRNDRRVPFWQLLGDAGSKVRAIGTAKLAGFANRIISRDPLKGCHRANVFGVGLHRKICGLPSFSLYLAPNFRVCTRSVQPIRSGSFDYGFRKDSALRDFPAFRRVRNRRT
jgi:hypothetical protein